MSRVTMPMPPEIAALLDTSPEGVDLTGPDGQPAARVVRPDEYRAMRKAFYDRMLAPATASEARPPVANPGRCSADQWRTPVEGE